MLTAKLILERFDRDHHLLERREQPSRSFLLQFIELLYVAHASIVVATPYAMTDITGAARDIDSACVSNAQARGSKGHLRIGSSGGQSGIWGSAGAALNVAGQDISDQTIVGELIGIVVGTGVVAVTPADYVLGTRIAHGRAAGELEYGGTELVGLVFADPNGEFTIRRYFTNLSGGGITVEEVGIYMIGCNSNSVDNWPFCGARDLTGGVAVADTELLRATYVVQITV